MAPLPFVPTMVHVDETVLRHCIWAGYHRAVAAFLYGADGAGCIREVALDYFDVRDQGKQAACKGRLSHEVVHWEYSYLDLYVYNVYNNPLQMHHLTRC